MMLRLLFAILPLACAGLPVNAEDAAPSPLAGCALSGASSVFIGGAPALRLSDVVNCPPELYEIVPGITIEGQPMVRVRSGTADSADCAAKGDSTVTANGEATQRIGDVNCATK